jgi:undecaprenyl-diphosphatase
MDGSLREALALGLVQGITYVLPVSSDGHLALMELVFGVQEPTRLFLVSLRVAAFVATCVVLRARAARLLSELSRALVQPSRLWTTAGGRDATTVMLASLPTALFGVFLREPVGVWARSPAVIGVGLVGTSAWLLSTLWLRPGRSESPGVVGALLIGVAQGLSVLPGLSRTAGTTVCALWLGVRPDRAFELSFLSSLPALLAMIVLDGRVALRGPVELPVSLVGALASLVSACAALVLLGRVVRRGRLALFASWTVPLAVATLSLALVWPH